MKKGTLQFFFAFVSFSIIILLGTQLIVKAIGDNESSTANNDTLLQLIRENIEFRKKFGLDYDLHYVKQVITDSHGSNQKFGVALTKFETEKLEERIANQEKFVQNVRKYISNNNLDDKFSGIYVNQENGGTIHIGFKSEVANTNIYNEIKAMYFDEKNVIFENMKLSQRDLDVIVENIVKNIEKLRELGVNVLTASTDLPGQKVDIYINSNLEESTKILEDFLGPNIKVEKGQHGIENASRSDFIRPLQGGVKINNTNRPGTFCTSGYAAKDQSGAFVGVTAGHCGYKYENFYQGGQYLGMMWDRQHISSRGYYIR
nr:hypothetical protein [Paenibacillus bovis]